MGGGVIFLLVTDYNHLGTLLCIKLDIANFHLIEIFCYLFNIQGATSIDRIGEVWLFDEIRIEESFQIFLTQGD